MLRIAGEVGAGRLVEGEVVGTGRAADGERPNARRARRATRAPRRSAEGSADSLPQLVDRLAANLLALGAGRGRAAPGLAHQHVASGAPRLPRRRGAPPAGRLPRRRAEVPGRAGGGQHLRPGRRRGGAGERVVFGRRGGRAAPPGVIATGCPVATSPGWRPSWVPAIPRRRAWATRSRRRSVSSQLAPDSPDAWYKLGDYLFHLGRARGHHRHLSPCLGARSTARCRSTRPTRPTIQHLSEIAAGLDDTAGVRRGLWPC